MDLHHLKQGAP